MCDVFVSYSTRGATTKPWVVKFVEDLKKYFSLKYEKDLSVWYAINENETGDNYRDEINAALKNALVFIMILDPKYIDSPQTLIEVNEYRRVRSELKQPEYFFKIIKWKGNKERELISFINSEIVVTPFTRINAEGNEQDYVDNDYINEIQNIVKAVGKRTIEESRKINANKIIQQVAALQNIPKIFVALGYAGSVEARKIFINQLSKTISRAPGLKDVKIFPDDFSVNLLGYDDLKELFYEDNVHGRECLEVLLNASSAAILLLSSDKINEAEDLLDNVAFQLEMIKTAAAAPNKKLPFHIFSDIPLEIYELKKFKEQISNPIYAAYENIKMIRGIDINAFIQNYLIDLEAILGVAPPVMPPADKHIYIIEYYNRNNLDTAEEAVKVKIESEKQHRRELRRYLADKKFVLIPSLRPNADLKETSEYHFRSLR